MIRPFATRSKRQRIRYAKADIALFCALIVVFSLFLVLVLYPLVLVVSTSFSGGKAVSAGRVRLFPVDFSLEGYRAVFRNKEIVGAFRNTVVYACIGTLLSVVVSLMGGYPLARADLPGRNAIMMLLAFTMYFGGGMIPSYMLMRNLGIIDTLWVMVVPGAISVYNIILTRTFIQNGVPRELWEAATIDGCNDTRYFFQVILPLSSAIIAVIALFSVVGHWNSYFSAMLYLNTRCKMPLQILLRDILVSNTVEASMIMDPEYEIARAELVDVLKYSLIVVSTAPIVCVYPFAQKHFIGGVMIGSLKG